MSNGSPEQVSAYRDLFPETILSAAQHSLITFIVNTMSTFSSCIATLDILTQYIHPDYIHIEG